MLFFFLKVVEFGFIYFELDVNLSKDGILVVIYDYMVDCMMNGMGRVVDYIVLEL